jgi:hypothetical protein
VGRLMPTRRAICATLSPEAQCSRKWLSKRLE